MKRSRLDKSRIAACTSGVGRPSCNKAFYAGLFLFSFLFALASLAVADPGAQTPQTPDYRWLSLQDCLSLARRYNPALGGAVEKIRELTADYRAARSQFFPQLTSAAYYERLEPDRLLPGAGSPKGITPDSAEGFAGVTGKQLLFNGGQTWYGTKAAKIGAQAQKQEALRTGDQVAFDVTRAFYLLMEAKENLNVARYALKQRQEFLRLTEVFFKAGKVTKLDFFRAKSQVSDARQAQAVAENALRLAREILARTIGLKEQTEVDIRGGLPRSFAPAPGIDSLWEEALEHNPEIRELNLQIKQNEALVNAAKGSYYPTLSLQGDLGTRSQDPAGTKGEWIAGVFVEFPIFEGGLRRAQVAAADSRHLQSIDKKRDRLNSLKIDLTTAWQDLKNSGSGVRDTMQSVETNEEAYGSARALYRNGKAIGLDVLQAQVDLTSSRFSLIKYKADYEVARARIRQILGTPYLEAIENGGRKQ
ncbi:MAG: TolC family protein [Syntrophobacteraceae bacterium]|nr:TolC family protein [Syntrophobacteraceae bacterium]